MINPIVNCYEWFASLISVMPQPLRAFYSLCLSLFVILALVSLFFRSK